MIPFFFFLFGIVIGSFLNVCISRIPEGISIVSPGSRCPRCLAAIKPYDNVPVLGWLWLKGKCRNCGLPISPMYPIVEFLTGVFFVLAYYEFGLTLITFKWIIFTCLIIVLDRHRLPRPHPARCRQLVWLWARAGLRHPHLARRLRRSDPRQNPPSHLFTAGVINALLGAAFGAFSCGEPQ